MYLLRTFGCVLGNEVFIFKFAAIDGISSSSVSPLKVASLKHELRDDSMELGAGVANCLSVWVLPSSGKGQKVIGSSRCYVVVQLHEDGPGSLTVYADVKKDHWPLSLGRIAGHCH